MINFVKSSELLKMRKKLEIDEYIDKIKPVVEAVKNKGDEALLQFTEKFDGVKLTPSELKIQDDEIEKAYEVVDDELIDALELAKENITKFHIVTAPQEIFVDFDYAVLGMRYVPIESVGLYIPGGRASYPSTVLMAALPASIAGVNRIVVCTPPKANSNLRINPLTLVACDIAGVDEIYAVGGAQAIAAMAYGTETINSVEKIVGPGNIYVTAAKILVSKDVAIDMPAGPSEILVIADESADAEFVALDCLAQLEHDPMAIAVLLTTSKEFAVRVIEVAKKFTENSEYKSRLNFNNFKIVLVNSIEEAIDISNSFAPEHLELVFENAEEYIGKVRNAGSVFIGNLSGVAFGDYASGTNHILPTSGYAKMFSGLSVETFMKHITFQQLKETGIERIGEVVVKLAEAEGLKMHAQSVKKRLEKLR